MMNFSLFEITDLQNLSELQPPDWGNLVPRFQYFIDSPHCRPIKLIENNEVIAIGTSMLHEDTAWLACIVVHPNHRKKGLGTVLTQQLINDLDRLQYQTIYLDATDFGYPVYKKIGFEVETEYVHLKRVTSLIPYSVHENILPFREEFKQELLKLDNEISGENRRAILSDFLSDAQIYFDGKSVQGFYIPHWGDGPVIASNDIAGTELMKMRCQNANVAILPSENTAALGFLEKRHFIPYKTSKRMLLGKKREWKATGIYNRVSGQLG